MVDDQGKWNFTDDNLRLAAIEAEADADKESRTYEAYAGAGHSRWWIVGAIAVVAVCGVQIYSIHKNGQPVAALDFIFGPKAK